MFIFWSIGGLPVASANFGNVDVLNRTYSLKKNKSFRYVYRRGKSTVCEHLVFYCVAKKMPGLQVGFSVSKKIGNAVTRNRVKRLLKEALRPQLEQLKQNSLLVIIARPGIEEKDFAAVRENMRRGLEKAGMFTDRSEPKKANR